MPQDDLNAAHAGLPERVFVGPDMFRHAFCSMCNDIRHRDLRGVFYTIELTSIGAVGRSTGSDEETLLDGLSERLIASFNATDLVARTGDFSFAVVATASSSDTARNLTRRLSNAIEELLHEGRRHGVVACCAVSQQPIDTRPHDHIDLFAGRTRHVIHDAGDDETDDRWCDLAPIHISENPSVVSLADYFESSGPST